MGKKKDVPLLVSAAGWIGGFVGELVAALQERGVPDEKIHAFVKSGEKVSVGIIADALAGEIRRHASKTLAPSIGRFFMTVILGEYGNVGKLEQAVLASGKKVGKYAGQILKKISISKEKIGIDLYEVSGVELGFTSAAPRQDIYSRAFELGFLKSPGEVGPLARIKCGDGKWLIVGMDPIADADDAPTLFDLDSDGDALWLSTNCGRPDDLWNPGHVWLFVWPRRK